MSLYFVPFLTSPCSSIPLLKPSAAINLLSLPAFSLLSEFCINRIVLCRLLSEIRSQIGKESKTLFDLIKVAILKAQILRRRKRAPGSNRFPTGFQGKSMNDKKDYIRYLPRIWTGAELGTLTKVNLTELFRRDTALIRHYLERSGVWGISRKMKPY